MNDSSVEYSYFHNWNWFSPKYTQLCEYLVRKITDPSFWERRDDLIWTTRHKEVKLYQVEPGMGDFKVAIKNYHERRFWRYFFRPSLAFREAMGFEVVNRLGISTAEVLAFGEIRRNLRQAYFVTRYEENTYSMLDFGKGQPFESEREKGLELMRRNIVNMAMLHKQGYRHGGAHPRNYLWRESKEKGLELIWIDLATVQKFKFGLRNQEICLDLTDMLEGYNLSQEQLDEMAGIYNENGLIRVRFLKKDVSERKFCVCRPL